MRCPSSSSSAFQVGKRVSFEPYITIKGQWLTSDSGDHGALYKLIATVSHRGAESSSGHYTADVLHPSGRCDCGVAGYLERKDAEHKNAGPSAMDPVPTKVLNEILRMHLLLCHRWLRFDDGDVLGVSSQQVFTDRPYLLLYQRLTEEDKAAVARRR